MPKKDDWLDPISAATEGMNDLFEGVFGLLGKSSSPPGRETRREPPPRPTSDKKQNTYDDYDDYDDDDYTSSDFVETSTEPAPPTQYVSAPSPVSSAPTPTRNIAQESSTSLHEHIADRQPTPFPTPSPTETTLRSPTAVVPWGRILLALAAVVGCGVVFLPRSNRNTTSSESRTAPPAPVSTRPETTSLRSYDNQRYGYTLHYPSFLIPQGVAANGDGQKFVSSDGSFSLAVWGSDKAMYMNERQESWSLADHMGLTSNTQGLNVTYKHQGKTFYVVSGFLGDKILYERVTFRRDVFYAFRLLYDRNRKQEYDSLPGTITKGFVIPN